MDNNLGLGNENQQSSDSLYSYSYVNQGGINQQYQNYQGSGGEPKKSKKEKKHREHKGSFGVMLGKCAALALVFGLVSGTVFYGVGSIYDYATEDEISSQPVAQVETQSTAPAGDSIATTTNVTTKTVVSDVSEVVEQVMPSIVSITNLTVQEVRSWYGQFTREIPSAGSGIIIAQTDEELYIATNNHVVSDSTTLTVTFVDDETVSAEIKGTDTSTDLAVISVKLADIPSETREQLKVAALGDSGSLKVGEPAIAIGNAMGYGQSVTTGVISALDREVSVTDTSGNTVTNDLIQTDAAINPGNSGGALLNVNGEVIGINSVKFSDTDVEGMGYAIPISMAEPIINDLINREVVDVSETAYLGVAGVDVTDEVAESYNMPIGIYVTQVVSGSAAEQGGILNGDIITSFDGRSVSSMDALAERMQYYSAGTKVEITLQRALDGTYVEETIIVTLGKKN